MIHTERLPHRTALQHPRRIRAGHRRRLPAFHVRVGGFRFRGGAAGGGCGGVECACEERYVLMVGVSRRGSGGGVKGVGVFWGIVVSGGSLFLGDRCFWGKWYGLYEESVCGESAFLVT